MATREEHDADLRRMEAYVTSNFIPGFPKSFAVLALNALSHLERGLPPNEDVFCPETEFVPVGATRRMFGFSMPADEVIELLRLEDTLSKAAVDQANEWYYQHHG